MSRNLIFILTILSTSLSSIAREIPFQEAKKLANSAFSLYTGKKMAKHGEAFSAYHIEALGKDLFYYAFNMKSGGFIILSADDEYNAVLAFSDEGQINFNSEEENIGVWGELSRHKQQIKFVRKKKLKANTKIRNEWAAIKSHSTGKALKKGFGFTPIVAPLTTTKWNQSGFYNSSCPADTSGINGFTYCGCQPIAVSQILRYYESGIPGNGSISYTDPIYGEQSADFCGKQYSWANMPDTLSGPNSILADFIYDVGKSMETHYSTSYTGTFVSKMRNAMVYNFGFDNAMKSYSGTDHEKYSSVLREEFDNNRVVFLSGWSIDSLQNADVGHTWVGDGYGYSDTGEEYMHFNWGWGGANNGWFLDTPGYWVPHEDNPEQDKVSYYWYRFTVYNIFPAGESCQTPDINVYEVDPADTYAWMYYRPPFDEQVSFRYRKQGSAEAWVTTEPTNKAHSFAGDLAKGTTYEYQLSRSCCNSWSSFSETQTFTTEGAVIGPEPTSCPAEDADLLFSSSITENFAFIYTTRPHGAVTNQFRYRVEGTSEWTNSGDNNIYYYALTNLKAGTSYEFQVRHLCGDSSWSEYSSSSSIKTLGDLVEEGGEGNEGNEPDEMTNDCDTVPASYFTAGYERTNSVTAYLLFSPGGSHFRFRYRANGTDNEWTVTEESTFTSANLTGLSPNTEYEYQISQKCPSGWSEFSESNYIRSASAQSQADTRQFKGNPVIYADDLNLIISPNPASDFINIEIEALHPRPDISTVSLELLTSSGQSINSIKLIESSQTQIDVSDKTPGIYFIRYITKEGKIKVEKFVKL